MATWLLQQQRTTAAAILISHIALHQRYIKINSNTIYFNRVRLEINSFRLRKIQTQDFRGTVLNKEINFMGNTQKSALQKPQQRKGTAMFVRKERKVLLRKWKQTLKELEQL
jgi:hypothetical protein